MKDGFVRIASASPRLKVADCRYNAEEMIKLIQDASAKSTAAVIFPELAVTGYTCGDLFKERTLISGAEAALARIIKDTAGCDILCGIGVPVAYKGGLYNCVAVFKSGKLLGLPAKKTSRTTRSSMNQGISPRQAERFWLITAALACQWVRT